MPLKVLHVVPSVSPVYGGPSEAIRGIAKAAVLAGGAAEIVATPADGNSEMGVPLASPVDFEGVRIRYLLRQVRWLWAISMPLLRWLEAHVCDYDLVHVHGVFSFPSAAAMYVARKSEVPYIVRPLGMLDTWSLSQS